MKLTDFITNKALSTLTTFKVGGPARYFAEPKEVDELINMIKFAKQKKLTYFVLGGGSNVLISDKGFDGLLIKLAFDSFDFLTKEDSDETLSSFSADFNLIETVNLSKMKELAGIEWAAGIPGTIGGAVRGNAGAFGGDISKSVLSVVVYDSKNDELLELDNAECEFGYRNSIFKTNSSLIILDVALKLQTGNKDEIEKEIVKNIKYRIKNHPMNFPSAGSTFKNISVKDLSVATIAKIKPTEQMLKNQIIPVGFVIEKLGLKGKKNRGAMISDKHANFIVNFDNAKARDIFELINLIKAKAKEEMNVEIEEEVLLLGF